jgi:hypothetical protein
MRSPGALPFTPVWEKVSVASIQALCASAASISSGLNARGCFATVLMVPAERPSFSPMPSRAASAAGLARAWFTSSRKYCS